MAQRRLVYLDHSASTPTDPRVVEAMLPYFGEQYGNASSVHRFGRDAESAIERARETVAGVLRCAPREVVFTSGGSESDNLAVRGTAWAGRAAGRGAHVVTTPVEHPAVSKTVEQLAALMGFERTVVTVDSCGQVDPAAFASALRPDTVVASVVYANNEVGTVLPLAPLVAGARARGARFHTDAVQAAGQLPLDVGALGVDLLSLSAHKFYGPKGVGALYVRDGVQLVSAQSGGSHEDGRRAGTQATPLIVGLARALELAYVELDARTAHYRAMRDRLIEGVLERVPDAYLTGHPVERLPAHASVVFEGVDGNALLMHLDLRGVAASSGSACKTGSPEPSSVLLALGYPPELALGSLRLTVGVSTTADDVSYALDAIEDGVRKLRAVRAGGTQ